MKTVLLTVSFFSFLAISNDSINHLKLNSGINDYYYKNRREKYPIGFNLMALGPAGFFGTSADWFITNKINIEAGIGMINFYKRLPSYFIGGKYHLFGNTFSNTTVYTGVFGRFYTDGQTINPISAVYVPVGLQRIKRNQVVWNLEVAYLFDLHEQKTQVWGSMKMGYRFGHLFNRKKKLIK